MSNARPCTCHPFDNPPWPCAMKYALSDCRAAEINRLNKWADGMTDAVLNERSTADAYQKELLGRIEQLEQQLKTARNDALEEAARICSDIAYKTDGFYGPLYAKAIRAAKEPV